MDFFLHMTERKINVNLSLQKNMLLLADLIRREPMPMVDYINGQGRLRRIILRGVGTKKEPYHFEWSKDYYIDT